MPINLTRRRLLGAGAALALAGCGNSPVARTAAVYWDQRGGGDRFTRDQVEQLPYATLAVGVGDGSRAMLVLSRAEGDDLHWVTADRVLLVTRHGRLVKTVGLAAGNLGNTTILDTDPLSRPELWNTPRQFRRSVDFGPTREFGVTLVADWRPDGPELISTFRGPRQALRVRERSHAPNAGWTLENTFWLDPTDAAIISSVQQIMPDTPPLRLECLKPYRG